jgi:glyoxylase-like metal-dependent hydrolase (beta-lactamase superfamily II)
MSQPLILEQIRHGPLWNFSYLVGDAESGECLIVDPGGDVDSLLARAAALGLAVRAAAITHFHMDHTRGLAELVRRTGAEVLLHHADEPGLRGHYRGPLRVVADGERRRLGRLDVQLWHAPGHTAGSQWLAIDGAVFTGDTLMVGCVGRTGPEDDGAWQMWETVRRLLPRLPADTHIYPGHDYGPSPWSTVGAEWRRNPCLSAATFDEFRRCLEP